jgi:hypothetical protein
VPGAALRLRHDLRLIVVADLWDLEAIELLTEPSTRSR